jgi:hypothetical protein
MKRLTALIISLLISTTCLADSTAGGTYGFGSATGGGGTSYIGFPGNATDNNPDTPGTSSQVTSAYSWVRSTSGIAGKAKRIRVYFNTNYSGNVIVNFHKGAARVGSASITPANGWVWSGTIEPVSGKTEADLSFTSEDTIYYGFGSDLSSGAFDVYRDANAGSYFYAGGQAYQATSSSYTDISESADLACILEYE